MAATNNILEEIRKLLQAGFTEPEIEENLRFKGFTDTEIKEAISNPDVAAIVAENKGGSISTKSILIGFLFLIIAFYRFSRYANGGNIFLGIGVITSIVLAVIFFTKKK